MEPRQGEQPIYTIDYTKHFNYYDDTRHKTVLIKKWRLKR
jgi:hypothetical protein